MKLTKLLLAGLLILGAAACDKTKEPKRLLDSNAKVSIHVTTADGTRAKGSYTKEVSELMERVNAIMGTHDGATSHWVYSVEEEMKDYQNNVIKMWGNAIIDPYTKTITRDFIGSRDVVFVDTHTPQDTLGYIPNRILIEAERAIRTAYDAGDFDLVYKLFHEAYRAHPITGEEWRNLKSEGKQ